MVSKQNGVHVFTGTTKDQELVDAIEGELEEDDDLSETQLVRDAVREYLGVE